MALSARRVYPPHFLGIERRVREGIEEDDISGTRNHSVEGASLVLR